MGKLLVVLDEVWDSALTDLGVKIASVYKGKVACAVVKGSAAERKCAEKGLTIFYVENPRKTFPIKPFFSLRRVLSIFNPNVVLTIRGEEMLFSSLLKKKFGFRLYRLHGEAKGIKRSFLNKYLHQRFLDGVILSSRKLLNDVVLGLKKVFIPGAVDTGVFRFSEKGRVKIRESLKVEDSILIGMVGRLDPVKGHVLFLKALSLLKGRLPVKGVILGEEKSVSVSFLKEKAAELGAERDVIFLNKRVSEITDYMSACDIGVIASTGSEMIARVPLEFIACGTPVVATKVGVLPEVISSKVGTCVDVDAESIAEGILKVVDNGMTERRDEIRKEACSRFSLDVLGRIVNDFLV